jgi:hypothetical protein
MVSKMCSPGGRVSKRPLHTYIMFILKEGRVASANIKNWNLKNSFCASSALFNLVWCKLAASQTKWCLEFLSFFFQLQFQFPFKMISKRSTVAMKQQNLLWEFFWFLHKNIFSTRGKSIPLNVLSQFMQWKPLNVIMVSDKLVIGYPPPPFQTVTYYLIGP